jgi:hypothetical protein
MDGVIIIYSADADDVRDLPFARRDGKYKQIGTALPPTIYYHLRPLYSDSLLAYSLFSIGMTDKPSASEAIYELLSL